MLKQDSGSLLLQFGSASWCLLGAASRPARWAIVLAEPAGATRYALQVSKHVMLLSGLHCDWPCTLALPLPHSWFVYPFLHVLFSVLCFNRPLFPVRSDSLTSTAVHTLKRNVRRRGNKRSAETRKRFRSRLCDPLCACFLNGSISTALASRSLFGW